MDSPFHFWCDFLLLLLLFHKCKTMFLRMLDKTNFFIALILCDFFLIVCFNFPASMFMVFWSNWMCIMTVAGTDQTNTIIYIRDSFTHSSFLQLCIAVCFFFNSIVFFLSPENSVKSPICHKVEKRVAKVEMHIYFAEVKSWASKPKGHNVLWVSNIFSY